jgi:methylisocitrate lyase
MRHDPSTLSKTQRLRRLLAMRTLPIPGAFNALSAIQIERAGYEIVYVSGAAISAARGLPDIGLVPLAEMAREAATIAQAVAIPTIVDADTGYGPPSAVREAVQEFEGAGLAGMQIEDQETAKKCGHLSGKRIIPMSDMVAKITAAVQAKQDRDFMIVARTDARAVEGLEVAIQRAKAYAEAGADALFPEALLSADEFGTFAMELNRAGIHVPLIANMTEFGKTPYLSVGEFEILGYRGVLFPVSALRAALRAVEHLLVELKFFGSQRHWLDHMMTRQELYGLLRYEQAAEQQRRPHEPSDTSAARD